MIHRSFTALRTTFPRLQQTFTTPLRSFQSTSRHWQQTSQGSSNHALYYQTHGRALLKSLTLAFFSYQCFYFAWITFESEEMKDQKSREIKSLQAEVRLLDEGRNSHQPSQLAKDDPKVGARILEERRA